MSMQEIKVEQSISLDCEQAFGMLADHARLGRLFPGHFRLLTPGEDPAEPNGVGAVRRIRQGPVVFEETVTVYEPAYLLGYRVSKGSPIKAHQGLISLVPMARGCRVDYRINFRPKLPGTGWILKNLIERDVRAALNTLGQWKENT